MLADDLERNSTYYTDAESKIVRKSFTTQLVTSSISQHTKLNSLEKYLPGHEAGLTIDEDMDGCERMFSTLRFNNCTIRDGSSTDEHAVGSSHN
jgi:hypothetical protein